MKFSLAAGLAFALAMPVLSQAAVVTTNFVNVAGPTWTVDLDVINDGAPAALSAFRVYFDEALFEGLTLTGNPSNWDTLLFQPDPDEHAPTHGILDSLKITGAPLALGQSQGGFQVRFSFLGAGAPPQLTFDIADDNFDVLFSGATVAAPAAVPEPGTMLLAVFGLGGLGFAAARRRAAANASTVAIQEAA